MKKRLLIILALLTGVLTTSAQSVAELLERTKYLVSTPDSIGNQAVSKVDSTEVCETIATDSLLVLNQELEGKVIVGADTIDAVIPPKFVGRFDRGLKNYLFMPKGNWGVGLTAGYSQFNTDDVQILSLLKDINIKGKTFSVKPEAMYFFDSNRAAGLRLGYSRNIFDLGSLNLEISEDISFSLSDVDYKTESYSAGIFYRQYIGLDKNRRFALFGETELSISSSYGEFKRNYDGVPRKTRTNTLKMGLDFSPGVSVFMHPNASFNVSFGIFGVHFANERQTTGNSDEGRRFTSGASFKFNMLNLNMGLVIHI